MALATIVFWMGRWKFVHIPAKGSGFLREFFTLESFKAYFLDRLKKDDEFRLRVRGLAGMRLGCFCKPNPCHGDVIAEWVNANTRAS